MPKTPSRAAQTATPTPPQCSKWCGLVPDLTCKPGAPYCRTAAIRFRALVNERLDLRPIDAIQLQAARALEITVSPSYTPADKLEALTSYLTRILVDAEVLKGDLLPIGEALTAPRGADVAPEPPTARLAG